MPRIGDYTMNHTASPPAGKAGHRNTISNQLTANEHTYDGDYDCGFDPSEVYEPSFEKTITNPTSSPQVGQDRWPSGLLEEANERYADASQRELEAGTLDQQDAKDQATRDKWDAMADRQLIRDELTRFFLGGFRIAFQEQPEQLKALLVEVFGTHLVDIDDAFADAYKRIVKLEGKSQ